MVWAYEANERTYEVTVFGGRIRDTWHDKVNQILESGYVKLKSQINRMVLCIFVWI